MWSKMLPMGEQGARFRRAGQIRPEWAIGSFAEPQTSSNLVISAARTPENTRKAGRRHRFSLFEPPPGGLAGLGEPAQRPFEAFLTAAYAKRKRQPRNDTSQRHATIALNPPRGAA